jgi:hypothetical protein
MDTKSVILDALADIAYKWDCDGGDTQIQNEQATRITEALAEEYETITRDGAVFILVPQGV